MKNIIFIILEFLSISAIVVLLAYFSVPLETSVIHFFWQREFLYGILLFFLYLSLAVTGSCILSAFFEKAYGNLPLKPLRAVLPMTLPIVFCIILGFLFRTYFPFAIASLLILIMVKLAQFVKKERVFEPTLSYRIKLYSIMMSTIMVSFLLLIATINLR